MVRKWTGQWSSKAEEMVNHMDNRQLHLWNEFKTKFPYEKVTFME